MNRQCNAKKRSGERCKAVAGKDGLCALHANPGRAAEMGRQSGRSRRFVVTRGEPQHELQPPRTAKEVRDILGSTMVDLHARRVDPKTASGLGYLANVLLKSIEISDVEKRLAALEAVLKNSIIQN